MPLPWLIGAAVVAAAAAVVKAVNDDDSPSSSYDSGDAERRRQEQEAHIQRKRDGLIAKVDGLKKDRIVEARDLLTRSVTSLSQLPKKTDVLGASDFENAFAVKRQSHSAYAQSLIKILSIPEHTDKDFSQKERDELLVNLQTLETLVGCTTFHNEEQRDLARLKKIDSRLERLKNMKQLLEQRG